VVRASFIALNRYSRACLIQRQTTGTVRPRRDEIVGQDWARKDETRRRNRTPDHCERTPSRTSQAGFADALALGTGSPDAGGQKKTPGRTQQRGFMPPDGGRVDAMPTYITLLNWTQKGIENVEGSLDRDEAGAEIVESEGGEVKDVYYTMGTYDNVVISEFPDDESYAKAILKVESEGYTTGQTLKALPEEIIGEFPE
jgi:uncharacterized protein with GYD domain